MLRLEIRLDDKVAWVTGGSRGIGRATCLALAKAGARVAVGFRTGEKEACSVVSEIAEEGGEAIAVAVNVGDAGSVAEAYANVQEQLGKIQILVNNAGTTRDHLFLMLEEEDWQDVIQTNVMGAVFTIKAVMRDLMLQRYGRIINVSSVAATKGGRGQANYAASKGALEAMSRSLAVELASRNITVNCIAPGVIETAMSAEVRKLAEKEILDRQLIKRFGKPEEIAAWIVMMSSEAAGFMTGQTIHVDGGLKMS